MFIKTHDSTQQKQKKLLIKTRKEKHLNEVAFTHVNQ